MMLRSAGLLSALLFSPISSFLHPSRTRASPTLFGKKKNSLRQIVTPNQRKKTTKTSSSKKQESAEVSPNLARWADGVPALSSPPSVERDEKADDAPETFSTFQKPQSERRSRQSARRQRESLEKSALSSLLRDILRFADPEEGEERPELAAFLETVRKVAGMEGSFRGMLAGPVENYRLAWVGSDDAICHLGTGLHKVPLARLQELFLTVGRNRLTCLEVVRIIGPFPNVKNTLIGTPSLKGDDLKICYTSMIDGTGKEILAGKEENKRIVDLKVLFGSRDALLCRVPGEEDAFRDEGKDLLVFVRENDLDTKLETLRVA